MASSTLLEIYFSFLFWFLTDIILHKKTPVKIIREVTIDKKQNPRRIPIESIFRGEGLKLVSLLPRPKSNFIILAKK